RLPTPRLGKIGNRILHQLRIVEREDVPADDLTALHERTQRRDLAHDLHQVNVRARIVVRPPRPFVREMRIAAVLDAREGESPVVLRVPEKGWRDVVLVRITEIAHHGALRRQRSAWSENGHDHEDGKSASQNSHVILTTAWHHGFFPPVRSSWMTSSSVCAFSKLGASS